VTAAIRYHSTRDSSSSIRFSQALLQGLAPDGGLYVPATWPRVDVEALGRETTLPAIATRLIAPFVGDDALAPQLAEITAEAFNFPAPLQTLADGLGVLELFHGPTAAFKDFGARFLAANFARLHAPGSQPLTILVATSGDTGGAVAAAFHGRPGINVGVLFPKGLVSPTQERQLTCWGGNVKSFQCQSNRDGFPPQRRMAAPAEHCDTRVRHGCGQSQ
jgi:threonine synthase